MVMGTLKWWVSKKVGPRWWAQSIVHMPIGPVFGSGPFKIIKYDFQISLYLQKGP